jgi:hypothetical protein
MSRVNEHPAATNHVPGMCQKYRRRPDSESIESLRTTLAFAFEKDDGPEILKDSGAIMERNTGFEPATFALARRRSTS